MQPGTVLLLSLTKQLLITERQLANGHRYRGHRQILLPAQKLISKDAPETRTRNLPADPGIEPGS